jgi:hypothetical protein
MKSANGIDNCIGHRLEYNRREAFVSLFYFSKICIRVLSQNNGMMQGYYMVLSGGKTDAD